MSASLLASTALAGSSEPPVYPVTQITPPTAATDWRGFYAGGMVSFDSAGIQVLINTETGLPTASSIISDNTSFGGFAGYNFQSGSFVYGGELAISSGGLPSINNINIFYDAVFDLKARAGYSFGRAMVYGVVGGSYSNLNWGALEFPTSGFSYGAGAEYMFNEHLFVGAEYLVRDLSGSHDEGAPVETSNTTQSAQLRVGWHF